jgi:hypothetical protein
MTAMTKVRTRKLSFAAMTAISVGLAWASLPASASTALRSQEERIATAALGLDGGGFGLRQASVPKGKAEVAYPPGGFKVLGTHGYSIDVLADSPHSVMLIASKRGQLAIYRAPATVDTGPLSFAASFGRLGSVSMSFIPTGGPPRVLHFCGERVLFRRGYFGGSFSFKGEGGYTVAGPTVKAPVDLGGFRAKSGCPIFSTTGPGGPGVELDARRRSDGVEFTAMKNRPRGNASFSASIIEHRGRLRIYRFAYATGAPSHSFVYDAGSRRAVVDPPPPFRGRGRFRQRRHHATGRWRGTLRASFPGRAIVRLAGGSFAAHISRFSVVQPR